MTTQVCGQEAGYKFVNNVGMLMTLISFSMLFATMFLGYAVFRLTSNTWPPQGMDRVNILYPVISTIIIFCSSFFLYFFEKNFKNYSLSKRRVFLMLTFLSGILFLFSQIKLWNFLSLKGVYASSGIFPSLIYAFTWVHAAHIILGLISLIYLFPTIIRFEYKEYQMIKIQNVGKFWHFLTVIWFIIFISIFVL